jgi:hypothetical protein
VGHTVEWDTKWTLKTARGTLWDFFALHDGIICIHYRIPL